MLPASARAAVSAKWADRVRIWSELSLVFAALGERLDIGWSLARGALRAHGHLEFARLRRLLAEVPQLEKVIRTLGRLQDRTDPDAPSVMERVFGAVRRRVRAEREVTSVFVPTETRGVERSGELARMLPSEAVLLRHPTLKWLFHARRAERALLTYRAEGLAAEVAEAERGFSEDGGVARPRAERGPMVLCVDTSGSMRGAPEDVAKAIALQALVVAHAEGRACYAYTFSGPGDVAEHQLSLEPEGVEALLAFLTMSFEGGTDLREPLARAVRRLGEPAWSHADILLVSDGAFEAAPETVARVREARERRGVRVHGVLVGGIDARAMERVCDGVHRFAEWERPTWFLGS